MKAAFAWLGLALLSQLATLLVFAWSCQAAYGAERTIAESAELPLVRAGLVAAGPLALAAVTSASWLLWRRGRALVAVPCTLALCMPSAVIAMLHLHTLGVLQCWW